MLSPWHALYVMLHGNTSKLAKLGLLHTVLQCEAKWIMAAITGENRCANSWPIRSIMQELVNGQQGTKVLYIDGNQWSWLSSPAPPSPKQTKLRVVNAMMMPVLMYRCETWSLQKEQRSKIQATQNECIEEDRGSVLEGPNHKQWDSAEAGQVGVLKVVKKRQEEWKGRLERMGGERCTKRAFEGLWREGDLEGDPN